LTVKEEAIWGRRINDAITVGVAKAIAEHKRAGRSIAVWRNGKVVIIPPAEIVVPLVAGRKIQNPKSKIQN